MIKLYFCQKFLLIDWPHGLKNTIFSQNDVIDVTKIHDLLLLNTEHFFQKK